MEQKTSDGTSSEQPEDANASPPPKKANVSRRKIHYHLTPQAIMQLQLLGV